MSNVANDIAEYLQEYHQTEGTAIKARELGDLFNVRGKPLRDIINILRQEAIPICSSWYGYWYSTEQRDIDKTLHQLRSRVKNINHAIAGLDRIGTTDEKQNF